MASEIRGLNGTLDAGAWTGSHTDVEVIASADDDTTKMSCARLDVPSTCKFSLQDTTYTNVASLTLRGRLKYEGGSGQATIYVKTSGGSTVVSKVCSLNGSYTTFEESATGPWTAATFNGFEAWCSFDTGDTPGVNDIRLTAMEVEAFEALGDITGPILMRIRNQRTRDVQLLKQSTAVSPKIGPFVDATDGDTEETGLTIAQADVRISKSFGAFAQKNSSTSCSHDEHGWYTCPLNTTDTGTLGSLQVSVHVSGALSVWHEFMVVPANVYDSLVAGSDNLDVTTTDSTDIAAIKAKTDNLPSDPADASDIASAFSTVNTKLDTIDDFLDTEIAAIKAKTDNLPSDPADASDIASSFSTVNTKLDTIDDFIDTEVAAIKAKTDNLPSSPAAVGSAMTLADGAITAAKIAADAITAAKIADGAIDAATFAAGAINAAAIASDAITAAKLASDAANEIATAVATLIGTLLNATGTAQAGATLSITLATGANANNDWYNGCEVTIESGTGAIQTRTITAYNGTSKVATVDRAWVTNPDNTSVYTVRKTSTAKLSAGLAIVSSDNEVMASAVVDDASPTASQFKGDTSLSSADDAYNGAWVCFTTESTTNKGQWRKVTDYVGSTRQFKFQGTGTDADAPFPETPADGDAIRVGGRA